MLPLLVTEPLWNGTLIWTWGLVKEKLISVKRNTDLELWVLRLICDTEINAGTIEKKKKKKKQRAQSVRSLINPNRRDSEQAEEGNKQEANKPDARWHLSQIRGRHRPGPRHRLRWTQAVEQPQRELEMIRALKSRFYSQVLERETQEIGTSSVVLRIRICWL